MDPCSSPKGTLAVVGLGYIGLPLAIEFSEVRRVIAYDIDSERVNELAACRDRTNEITVDRLKQANNITYTSDPSLLLQANIYIIAVPTPVDSACTPDLSYLESASSLVAKYLKPGDFVIYESTVFPGATEEICIPLLSRESKLTINEDFFVGYSPERINPGDKNNTLRKIIKITSGSNEYASNYVDSLYSEIVDAGTFPVSSIAVAEAAKVIENAQRDINIAFVNELSIILNLLGIDTNEVLTAASSKWNFLNFKPGLVGGHCIGVDPYYLAYKSTQCGHYPELILSGRRLNDSMHEYVASAVLKKVYNKLSGHSNPTIAILGLTFKDNCPDLRNSKSIALAKELLQWNVNLILVDDWACQEELASTTGIVPTPFSKLASIRADAIIVSVMHSQFAQLGPQDFVSMSSSYPPVLADLKSIYSLNDCKNAGIDIFRL